MLNITNHQGNASQDHKNTTAYQLEWLLSKAMKKKKRKKKKTEKRNYQVWQGCGEIRTIVCYWWECKIVQPLYKTV